MDRGIVLVENLSIGDIPNTPQNSNADNLTLNPSRNILLKYAQVYGWPISFAQEQKGQLIQNIFPVKKTENQQISTSSKVELGLHTETAFHPYKPTAVLLLCLRGDPNAVTTYAYVDEIVKHLEPSAIDALTKLWFTTSIDDSFRTNGESDMELTCSVLRDKFQRNINADRFFEITYDEVLMKGINDEAIDALEHLKNAIKNCTREIVLKAGDLLIINNRTTVHGRRPFDARYDGTDRWVQRILAIETLPPPTHRNGYKIITKFGK